MRSRPWAGDDASKNQLLSSLTFDKGKLSQAFSNVNFS